MSTSTNFAFWCHELDCVEDYKVLREQALPRFNNATLNVWFANNNYESLLDSPERLAESGFGTSIHLPDSMSDLPSALPRHSGDMLVLDDFEAFRSKLAGIAFLASRHWKLQLPHDIPFALARAFTDVPGERPEAS
ncbi:hypothetical protein IQ289_02305 [Burkholderia sp. R-70006]|uniref:hypothetical protein n=1 Tax=Paraburkholderia domus TaxID=2793075 RepID=UPI001914954E|nr:hypothetical protein [Paraburkholderia domus]MBK5047228.1 hypothetical protein [Burkholderia sp. R-70006]